MAFVLPTRPVFKSRVFNIEKFFGWTMSTDDAVACLEGLPA